MSMCLGQCKALALACLLATLSASAAQSNCRTELGRIVKAAALLAVEQNKDVACSSFKLGPAAIDKTHALELTGFELCERGSVVIAGISVRNECATTDQAVVRERVSDTPSAQASANLGTMSDARVWAEGFLSQVALDWANANQRLKDSAEREIRRYCAAQ